MSVYLNKLIKFLPVKKTTSNISTESLVDGQVLFETDEKHRLFVDYADNPNSIPTRHLLIDSQTILYDFDVDEIYNSDYGRSLLQLYDENDNSINVEIPITNFKKAINDVRVVKSNGEYTVYYVGVDTHVILQPTFYISVTNTNEETILACLTGMDYYLNITNFGGTDLCCPIEVESIEYIDNNNEKYILLKFPRFTEDLYGIDMTSNTTLDLQCYFYMSYDKNNNFWRN